MTKTYHEVKGELDALNAEHAAIRVRLKVLARERHRLRVMLSRKSLPVPTSPFGMLETSAPSVHPVTAVRQVDDLSHAEFNRLLADMQSARS